MISKLSILSQSRKTWAYPYAIFLLFFVLLPLVMIAIYAFEDMNGAFTLHNFEQFFVQSDTVNTFIYSLGVSLITTIICFILGFPAAYFMASAATLSSRSS